MGHLRKLTRPAASAVHPAQVFLRTELDDCLGAKPKAAEVRTTNSD